MPNPSPAMQKRIPIISSLWPSMPRNDTEDRSGSFRPASPPASGADWAAAADAPRVTNASTATDRPRAKRDTRLASQVRIASPPLMKIYIRMTTGSGYLDPAHRSSDAQKRASAAYGRSSEHASTARLEQGC